MKKHLIILISAVIFLGTYTGLLQGEAMAQTNEIPTSNMLYRVLPIKVGNTTGTVFTMEVDGKQYLITAKHVTNHQAVEAVEIWIDGWKPIKVKTVGIGKGNEDIIVLTANMKLSETFDIEIGSGGILLGQDVRFLGFPLGLESGYIPSMKERKIPLVKGGILSGVKSEENASWLLVDGHNNGGFSGGPVIFKSLYEKTEIWKIAGVISGYEPEIPLVMDSKGREIKGLVVLGNSGILVATGIKTAVELIKANPIGYSVKNK